MSRADFVEGLRGGFTVAVASAPFAALFGALAVDNGMSLSELTLMSATVYAGASQMVGIELFGQQRPGRGSSSLSISRRQFPPCPLFGGDRPLRPPFHAAAEILHLLPARSTRNLPKTVKRGESGKRSHLHLVSRLRHHRSMSPGCWSALLRRAFRADASAIRRALAPRRPAAGLFPWSGASAFAASRDNLLPVVVGERRSAPRSRYHYRRLALACQHRCRGRTPGCVAAIACRCLQNPNTEDGRRRDGGLTWQTRALRWSWWSDSRMRLLRPILTRIGGYVLITTDEDASRRAWKQALNAVPAAVLTTHRRTRLLRRRLGRPSCAMLVGPRRRPHGVRALWMLVAGLGLQSMACRHTILGF